MLQEMGGLSWTPCSWSNWCVQHLLHANSAQFHQITPFGSTNKVIHWRFCGLKHFCWLYRDHCDHVYRFYFGNSICVSKLIFIEQKTLAGIGKKSYKISLGSWVLKYTSTNSMQGISRDNTKTFWQIVTFWNWFLMEYPWQFIWLWVPWQGA